MNILEKIADHQRHLVTAKKKTHPINELEKTVFFEKKCRSLSSFVSNEKGSGLIAEFKRASPSNKNINPSANSLEICPGYDLNGASALSVLTNEEFFSGRNSDIEIVSGAVKIPILRKEFIVDEYQIIESKAIGADAILLILSLLTKEEIKSFTQLAHKLGLEVLAEIHEKEDLVEVGLNANLLGVNSRSLKLMKILPDHHEKMFDELKIKKTLIAESGIKSAKKAYELHKVGYNGFLVGSLFMEQKDPINACKYFVRQLEEFKSVPKANS